MTGDETTSDDGTGAPTDARAARASLSDERPTDQLDLIGGGVSEPDVAAGGMSQQRLQSLAMRGSLWTAIYAVSSLPLNFVSNVVVARSLGVEGFGSLALLTVVFMLTLQLANAGFSDAVIRFGAAAEASGRQVETDRLLSRSLGYHVVVELPILLLASALVARSEGVVVLVALVTFSVATCLLGGATLAMTLENRSAAGAKIAMVSNVLVQLIVMVVALVTQDAATILAARLVAMAANLPFAFLFLSKRRRHAAIRPRLPRGMPVGFWPFARHTFVASVLASLVFSRSEVFFLQVLSTPEALGLFALAFGLSYQMTAPADAILGPLLPAISGLMAAHPDAAERAFLRATRFASLVAGLVTAIVLPIVYFAVPLIYGSDFGPAAVLLLPLGVASCLQSISHPVTAFAYGRAQGTWLVRANGLALVAGSVIAVAAIPLIGVWGAVVANVVGQTVAVLALAVPELRCQGITMSTYLRTLGFWLLSLAVAAAAVVVGELARAGTGDAVWGAGVAACVGAAGLFSVARWGRDALEPGDGRAVLEAMPRRARRPAAVLISMFGPSTSETSPHVPREDTAERGSK